MKTRKRSYQTKQQFDVERAYIRVRSSSLRGVRTKVSVLRRLLRSIEHLVDDFDWNWHDPHDRDCCAGRCPEEMDLRLHPAAMLLDAREMLACRASADSR